MKECEFELTQKGDMVSRLQLKASQIGKLLQTLETRGRADAASAANRQPKSETVGPPVKKPHYIDPIPPFNANKIRKSPSATLPATAACTSSSISSTTPTADAPPPKLD